MNNFCKNLIKYLKTLTGVLQNSHLHVMFNEIHARLGSNTKRKRTFNNFQMSLEKLAGVLQDSFQLSYRTK